MRVDELWDVVVAATGPDDARLAGNGDGSVVVTEVHHDSRQVTAATLFCCVPGGAADGHDYAQEAVAAGAVALLCERPLDLEVPQLLVPSTRAAMGPVAAAVYGHPSRDLQIVGVTGTNGKTTTVHLTRTILEASGRTTEVIGTLTGARTTPEAPDLQRQFAAMRARGVEAVAMEVSSHTLAQHRVSGTHFAVAVFTNLSRDHLDFHHDMSAYFQAKARLFEPTLSAQGVVNVDDPQGRLLLDAAQIPTTGFSIDDVEGLELATEGSTFRWREQQVRLPLVGDFNVANALAAATAAEALGVGPSVIASGLAAVGPVPGRFEVLDEGQPFLVVVDFAHTPDGLSHALRSARLLAGDHRVLLVFGAGGDRDRSKRPEMGEAAARGADVVVITTDNPRSEDPMAIIEAVRSGVTAASDTLEVSVEPDRREAIDLAVASARRGDVVLIAGKGHETTQTIGPNVLPFDDREVARAALRHRETHQ